MNTKLSRRHFNRERIADPSTWVPSLELTYDKANDGSATVINRYDFPIQEDRVRFVMPTGASYAVSGGRVVQAFDGDHVHIVDVRVTAGPDSRTEIAIGPGT